MYADISNSSVENSIKFYSPFSDEIVAKSVLKHHMRENLVMVSKAKFRKRVLFEMRFVTLVLR